MPDYIPNVRLRAWRNQEMLNRAQMAEKINATPIGVAQGLACDEERIRRWEAGEVRWPRTEYRLALTQLTGKAPEDLGFSQGRQNESRLIEARVIPADALRAEADLYGTMELAQQLQASDVGAGTLEALAEAVDLLCRAYPVVPAGTLRDRTQKRLAQINHLLAGRLTLDQHRELLLTTGWLTALLGCAHYDLGRGKRPKRPDAPPSKWAARSDTANSWDGHTRCQLGSPLSKAATKTSSPPPAWAKPWPARAAPWSNSPCKRLAAWPASVTAAKPTVP
ncbi:hypothetical protein AB0L53_35985 [Nonomuraea sp. NPDC052129]|uniref:hypothetical protein n=1 Tax=Nonomuraea sp. NPDC052129 TaxID=3154651 RepID=UPI0034479A40